MKNEGSETYAMKYEGELLLQNQVPENLTEQIWYPYQGKSWHRWIGKVQS